jgi:K+-transporting ATPase A subunit
MKKNMGTIDRIIRLVLFAAFAGLYFGGVVTGTLGIIMMVVGAVFLLTSFIGHCPLYLPFGISTCEKKPGATE